MNLTPIVMVLGIILVALACVVNYRRSEKKEKPNYPMWGVGVLGVFFAAMPTVFASILIGFINGFIELPNHITAPNLELSFNPIWTGSLILGVAVGIFVAVNISRRAKSKGMTYGEYIASQRPDYPDSTDQTETEKTSSDQPQN